MLGIVIMTGLLLFSTAAGVRATRAYQVRRRRHALAAAVAREARDAADQAAQEARDAAAQAASDAAAKTAKADQEARDARHRAHPESYISLQSGKLQTQVGPLGRSRAQLDAEQGEVRAELALLPTPRLLVQISTLVCLLVLPLLWIISVSQMIPSFAAMSLPPSSIVTTLPPPAPLDVLYGLLWATAEISVALALAHVLHSVRPATRNEPAGSRDTGSADSNGAAADAPADAGAGGTAGWAAATFWRVLVVLGAGVLIYGQYSWAPAHDMVPMTSQLTVATNQYSLDQADGAPAQLLTADQQKIGDITARMPALRERDQAMALVVTLLADGLAVPGLLSLEYLAAAGRRRRLRQQVTSLASRIATLEQREGQITDALTYETQVRLDALGHSPARALAAAATAPSVPTAPVPPPPALPTPVSPPPVPPTPVAPVPPTPTVPATPVVQPPAPPAPPPASGTSVGTGTAGAQGTGAPAPGGRTLTTDDLFPSDGYPVGPDALVSAGPAGDDDELDDRRWTDPL